MKDGRNSINTNKVYNKNAAQNFIETVYLFLPVLEFDFLSRLFYIFLKYLSNNSFSRHLQHANTLSTISKHKKLSWCVFYLLLVFLLLFQAEKINKKYSESFAHSIHVYVDVFLNRCNNRTRYTSHTHTLQHIIQMYEFYLDVKRLSQT